MAKRYQKRYYEYRGRRRNGGSTVLKIIIAMLVLILVAFGVLMVFMGGRVEYTDDGVRLVLPWMDENPDTSDDPSDPLKSDPPTIIIEDPEETSDEPSSESSPEPAPKPVLEWIGAVQVSRTALIDGTAAGLVTAADGNTLVVEMKATSGKIYWDSAAALPGALADEDGAITAAVQALSEQGSLHLVARVVCFRDQIMAADKVGGPLMTRGGNQWYDTNGLRWVSPASEDARNYLTRLCLELAELGFDEILLEYAGYPHFGETHVLATDDLRPEDLSSPVELFWRELKAALAEQHVQLSVLATGGMVLGTEQYSGVTPELLERYADRVWTTARSDGENLDGQRVLIGGTAADGSWAQIDPTVN